MKKHILIAMSVLGLLCLDVEAQTIQNTNTIPSFVSTAEGYFSSFNTNLLTFQSGQDNVDITTGTENWNNAALLATFHGDARIFQTTTNTSLRGVVTFYNDTTLGSLSKADAGGALAYSLWDTKTTASLNGGYDWAAKGGYIRPDLKFEKAMTQHTFLGINIGLPLYFHGQGNLTPNYGFDAGFNF